MKYNLFWITSDFPIDLLQCTSELQTPITFLFVDKNMKCGYAFSQLEHKEYFGTKLFGFAKIFGFSFFAPPLSV